MRKSLVAGPWIGEFGWELLQWQGIVRAKVSQGNYGNVVVCSYEKSRGMYADFATHFVPLPPAFVAAAYPPDGLSVSMRWWNTQRRREGLETGPVSFDRDRFTAAFFENYDAAEYDKIWPHFSKTPTSKQAFADWTRPVPVQAKPKLIALVKRHRSYHSHTKNWPEENWAVLESSLKQRGFAVEVAQPDWEASLDLFSRCALVVGGSTGGMHLASLCRCPHMVWSHANLNCDGVRLRERYRTVWNPHGTACYIADITWRPSVPVVLDHIARAVTTIGRG